MDVLLLTCHTQNNLKTMTRSESALTAQPITCFHFYQTSKAARLISGSLGRGRNRLAVWSTRELSKLNKVSINLLASIKSYSLHS